MKQINIISLFPEMLSSIFSYGVLNQGLKKKVLEISYTNPRDFTADIHRTVDDRPYGGGEGMVMMAEPLKKSLDSIPKKDSSKVIYLSPQGKVFDHSKAEELSKLEQLIFVCGRYEGVDQRFISKYVDEEISIGNYILSGGELACAIVLDSVARFFPGLLGNQNSNKKDSFQMNGLLKYPPFTRPEVFEGLRVPDVLLSGNHESIDFYRKRVGILTTYFKRPELLRDMHSKDLKEALLWYQSLQEEEKYVLGLLKP